MQKRYSQNQRNNKQIQNWDKFVKLTNILKDIHLCGSHTFVFYSKSSVYHDFMCSINMHSETFSSKVSIH